MGKTSIEWTMGDDGTPGATWNPIRGCSRVSTGCENCYAEQIAARFSGPGKPYEGLATMGKNGPRWTGEVRLIENALGQPLRWREPRRIFVNSMSDLFHEKLSDEQIAAVFGVMAGCPQHTFQVLTKRPARMVEWFQSRGHDVLEDIDSAATQYIQACYLSDRTDWPLPNVWLGVSTENQATADERIPFLLKTPAAVRFVSCEPLLGPIDLDPAHCQHCGRLGSELVKEGIGDLGDTERQPWCYECDSELCYGGWLDPLNEGLGWVIVGTESGPGARPMQEQWVRSIRNQCTERSVPLFYKQALDERGHKISLPLLDGVQWSQFPEVRHG